MATQTEPRLPLSRDRILRAALELADEGGIDALTMRKLGQVLGFEAMSLYNHVANKDDVLRGIIDLVLAETQPPAPVGDWSAAIRNSAISVHDALTRHLEYMDSLLGRLREAGFSADDTYHAYHVLDAHIFGFSLWQANHSYNAVQLTDLTAELDRMIPVETYPHLHEHGEQHFTEGSLHEVSAFELGLDLILDGLEKIRAA